MNSENIKKIITGSFGIGLACIAAYLDVNDVGDSGLLWIGVFCCFLSVVD